VAGGRFVEKAVLREGEWLEQGVRTLLSIWRDRRLLFQVSIALTDASRRGAKKATESHRMDVFEGWKVEGKTEWGKVRRMPGTWLTGLPNGWADDSALVGNVVPSRGAAILHAKRSGQGRAPTKAGNAARAPNVTPTARRSRW